MGNQQLCDHCGEEILHEVRSNYNDTVKHFCCFGCQSVFEILNAKGLTDFYQLRNASPDKRKPTYTEEKYNYLDDPDFKEKYCKNTDNGFSFSFFVEGVHCAACLWVLEKLDKFYDRVVSAKLNMSTSILKIELKTDGQLSEVAKQVAQLGYVPHPILNELDKQKLAKAEERKILIRIGIAFACAGNIMLYSLAVYAGADGAFRDYFNLFSFIAALPVLFYSALPFYQSAWGAIKTKTSSIDIPIVAALIVGFFLGAYSLFTSVEYYYFDTLATLVFLLLGSRFLLKKAQQKTLGVEDLSSFFATQYALKILGESEQEVLTKFLQPGDTVRVGPNEAIPIDGEIIHGRTHINNSLLTGEIRPERRSIGDKVFMGAKNLDQEILLKVSASVDETRFGKMLAEIESGWHQESKIALITDRVAKRFITVIFILSVFFLIYFGITAGFEVAFTRTLSLLIITCPCALALTTPLALILSLSQMAKLGVIVKDESIIEKLTQARAIFLDKTGTLTRGDFRVLNIEEHEPGYIEHLYTLELNSKHPIAVGIVDFLKYKDSKLEKVFFEQVYEVPGKGVEGSLNQSLFEVKRVGSETTHTTVGLFKDGKLMITVELADSLRPGVKQALFGLQKLGLKPHILTGDTQVNARKIGHELELGADSIYAEKSPEEKRDLITQNKKCIMIGDGVNDAIALKAAFVGIAVKGSVEVSLRAADVYLSNSGVSHVLGLVEGARYTMNLIYKNLTFSFVYNLVGIFLAFTGQVSPLVAAILMPLSSVTVLLSTVFATRKLKSLIL